MSQITARDLSAMLAQDAERVARHLLGNDAKREGHELRYGDATGAAGNAPVSDVASALYRALASAVEEVCVGLATDLVRDGEGASKFVTVQVDGGRSEQECLDVAFTIAHSPLVKTALFASDPNWGRLLAAIGRAGLPELDVSRVGVWLPPARHACGLLIAHIIRLTCRFAQAAPGPRGRTGVAPPPPPDGTRIPKPCEGTQ